MPRKPGGKYKGKCGREKGPASIALDLENKRRAAYEKNLKSLQEQRNKMVLQECGMMSAEEEERQRKMDKIAQMFGSGKKGTLTKFWKNWRIGITESKKTRALDERKTCWKQSCNFCSDMEVHLKTRAGDFAPQHCRKCTMFWDTTFGHEDDTVERDPAAAARDRPAIVNELRACACCGADVGLPVAGCRCYLMVKDAGFMSPSEHSPDASTAAFAKTVGTPAAKNQGSPTDQKSMLGSTMSTMAPSALGSTMLGSTLGTTLGSMASRMFGMSKSASGPLFPGSPHSPALKKLKTLSADENWVKLRNSSSQGALLEYDPSIPFMLTPQQKFEESRRVWSDELTNMAGSPGNRQRSGTIGLPKDALPALSVKERKKMLRQTALPVYDTDGFVFEEVAHWRTGQKALLNSHLMTCMVVGDGAFARGAPKANNRPTM